MKPKPLDLDEFWKENFHNARRFFTSKGNLKTRIKLKNKWKKEFYSRIKFACEFFLKYKDRPKLFSEKEFKIVWEYDRETGTYLVFENGKWYEYNEWLFRLSFRGWFDEEEI